MPLVESALGLRIYLITLTFPVVLLGDCALFHESFENTQSIIQNYGKENTELSFEQAVNGNGVNLDGSTSIVYPSGLFVSPAGSVSFWFRKNSPDEEGGILQSGTLGYANSLGVFYANQTDITFEMRNNSGDLTTITAPGVLGDAEFVHILVAWENSPAGSTMWIYINGYYANWGYLAGSFDRLQNNLHVGSTAWYEGAEGIIDELRVFDWALHDSEVYAEYIYSSNLYTNQSTGKPLSSGKVQVIGKSLYLNGKEFKVKGVAYQPTPIGHYPWTYPIYTDTNILNRDVAILKAMNVNTIRTWDAPPDDTLLNIMYSTGIDPIYVLIGFSLPTENAGEEINFADQSIRQEWKGRFENVVSQFKDHPGLLGWVIGNEMNLSLSGQNLVDWYEFANELAKAAYDIETNGHPGGSVTYHPTIIDNGGMLDFGNPNNKSDDMSLTYVDMWGHNTYLGWDGHCYFDYYDRITTKPLVFTEFGIDAWDNENGEEYPDVHAAYVVNQWRQVESGCTGGTVMAYSDEWWKDMGTDRLYYQDYGGYHTRFHPDGYSNEEWYGVAAVARNPGNIDTIIPRQAFCNLAREFAHGPGDYDGDIDVDLADFRHFQLCFGLPVTLDEICGAAFDFKVDGMIDHNDFILFFEELSKPNQ